LTPSRRRGDETVGGLWREAGHEAIAAYRVEFGSTTEVAFGDGVGYLGETTRPRIGVFDLSGHRVQTIARTPLRSR
jgi:hypothetical protein